MRHSDKIAPWLTRVLEWKPWHGSKLNWENHVETSPVLQDRFHHLTTDLFFWKNQYFLVHATSPWHISSSHSVLKLWKSQDGKTWEWVKDFDLSPLDIRDPKLFEASGKLGLLFYSNKGFFAEPRQTFVTFSEDLENWSDYQPIEPEGWLLWRVRKSPWDGKWYSPAYWYEHGKAALFSTADFIRWDMISMISEGDHSDEVELEFFPDGRALAVVRIEGSAKLWGDEKGSTLIAESAPPYADWKITRCYETRLDGPCLFHHSDYMWALGRKHFSKWWNKKGGYFGKKRTSLYQIKEGKLNWILDFPSTGDTGYPGVVVESDRALISYYTNRTTREKTWLSGLFLPSEIRIASLSFQGLNRV